MEAGGIGVNSPEFLQKKIERLKTALDEANVLMDRQVTERDEARGQLDGLRRENQDLRRELDELRAQGGGAQGEVRGGLDPELEQSLRDRIAELERERESLQSDRTADAADQELRDRVDALQSELDASRGELTAA